MNVFTPLRRLLQLTCLVSTLLTSVALFAQNPATAPARADTNVVQRITMRDGTVYIGRVVGLVGNALRLQPEPPDPQLAGKPLELSFSDVLQMDYTAQKPVKAPLDTAWRKITMRSGEIYVGRIVGMENGKVSVQLRHLAKDRPMSFDMSQVARIEQLDNGTAPQTLGVNDPAASSLPRAATNYDAQTLIFSPTGYTLKAKENLYETYYFITHTYTRGFTDNIQGGGGVALFIPEAHVKAGVELSPTIHAAVGATALIIPNGLFGFNSSPVNVSLYGIGYAALTIGKPTLYLNASGGQFFIAPTNGTNTIGYLSLGGGVRLSPRWMLLTDNFFITSGAVFNYNAKNPVVPNIGARVYSKKGNTAVDFGLIGLTVPYIAIRNHF